MADELQFGDRSTTDVKLQFIHQRNPLHVHSDVLRKSEYYNTLLSERWSSENKPPFEFPVPSRYNDEIFIKCIQLMYSSAEKPLSFSNVDEALAILSVVSELLFQQGMNECMKYLRAVPWSTKQEVKLRALLLSLEIEIWDDLRDRLGLIYYYQRDVGSLETLEQTLQKMLSTISCGFFDDSEYIEEYIIAHFKENKSFAETCTCALLKEFRANMECANSKSKVLIACSALSWMVNVIERCDWQLFERVFEMFCRETDIPKAICQSIEWERQYSYPSHRNDGGIYSRYLLGLLDRILKALGNGQIITYNDFRVSFLTHWIPVFVNLKDERRITRLAEGMVVVAETLSMANQRSLYNIAKGTMNGNGFLDPYTKKVLEDWGKKVQITIIRHNKFFNATGGLI